MQKRKLNQLRGLLVRNWKFLVQPGVTNLGISKAVEHEGFYYAPDPSSQIACSIESMRSNTAASRRAT